MSIPKLPSIFLMSLYAPCQEVDYREAHQPAYPEPPVKAHLLLASQSLLYPGEATGGLACQMWAWVRVLAFHSCPLAQVMEAFVLSS